MAPSYETGTGAYASSGQTPSQKATFPPLCPPVTSTHHAMLYPDTSLQLCALKNTATGTPVALSACRICKIHQ